MNLTRSGLQAYAFPAPAKSGAGIGVLKQQSAQTRYIARFLCPRSMAGRAGAPSGAPVALWPVRQSCTVRHLFRLASGGGGSLIKHGDTTMTDAQSELLAHNSTIDAADLGMEAIQDLRGLLKAIEKLATDSLEIHTIAHVGINIADDIHNLLDCSREEAENNRTACARRMMGVSHER